jgi:hypothetical protein
MRNLEELKFAELQELCGIELPTAGNVRRYEGLGKNEEEALTELMQVCEQNDLPEISIVKGKYICGTIKIYYIFSTKRRLNPVFISKRDGHFIAYIYR